MASASTSKDSALYGLPRPKKSTTSKDYTTPSTLTFTSALSSLISAPKPPTNSSGTSTSTSRPRKSSSKGNEDDIFTSTTKPNRGTQKRKLADEAAHAAEEAQAGNYRDARMDDAAYKRQRRKMQEKARLYAAMKRGDVEDESGRHMVDFDAKWAEKECSKDDQPPTSSDEGSDDEMEEEEEEEEQVEYTDEFGRTRRGSRFAASLASRRREQQADGRTTARPDTLRPQAPQGGLIYGDTIQHAAFNPDHLVQTQMEELAKKRDRELTPPEESHYDASAEVRSKGTGFFQFSRDKEERDRQMRELERERVETERVRREKGVAEGGKQTDAVASAAQERLEARRRLVEEKRRKVEERKASKEADAFLEGLGQEMSAEGGQKYEDETAA